MDIRIGQEVKLQVFRQGRGREVKGAAIAI